MNTEGKNTSGAGECFAADVIIIGLGLAGTAALRAARETGADVIGLETMDYDGYRLNCTEFSYARRPAEGERDYPETVPQAGPPDARMQALFRQSEDAFDWFTDMFPAELREELECVPDQDGLLIHVRFPGISRGGLPLSLEEAVRVNMDITAGRGAVLFFGTTALEVRNNRNGEREVLARGTEGQEYIFCARRGIVLAAGKTPEAAAMRPPEFAAPVQTDLRQRLIGSDGGVREDIFAVGSICEGFTESLLPSGVRAGAAVTLGRAAGIAAAVGAAEEHGEFCLS